MNNFHPFLSAKEEKEFASALYEYACYIERYSPTGWLTAVITNMKKARKPTWHLLQFRRNAGRKPIRFNY